MSIQGDTKRTWLKINTFDKNIKINNANNDGPNCSDFNVPLRRYGYLCIGTLITRYANKLRDFQCKFTNVRMAIKKRYDENRISV